MKVLHWFFIFIVFFVIAALIYSPSLGGPWQYDDYAQILDRQVLTGRPLPKLLSSIFRFTAHPDGWTGTRDFVRATFLVNWQWWGEEPLGYRWTNLTIHVINAWLVTLLVWQLFQKTQNTRNAGNSDLSENQKSRSSGSPNLRLSDMSGSPSFPSVPNLWIAVFSGLLFLVHPLNSQAVAYVAQRFTSVATLFYLLTVILWWEVCETSHLDRRFRKLPYLAALVTALLAYNSKEIAVTLPIVLLLVGLMTNDKLRMTNDKKPKAFSFNIQHSTFFILPFFLLALKIPLQTATAAARGGEAPATTKIELGSFALQQKEELVSREDYFLTQISVVGTYLRLAVLPVGQTLDYDYPISRSFDPKTLGLAAFHLSLIGSGSWLLLRSLRNFSPRSKVSQTSVRSGSSNPLIIQSFNHSILSLIGLGILWFYLTLLPESSIIPIPDVIYEHRAYLPMVGLIIAAAGGMAAVFHKSHKSHKSYGTYAVAAAAIMLILAASTLRRAYIWGNEVRLWADVYAKAPQKPRAVKNYGVVLAAAGKYDRGIELLEKAVVLDGDNADYWSNLGTANLRAGRFDAAKDKFLTAYSLLAAELNLPSYDSLNLLNPPNSLISLSEKNRRQAAQYLNDYGVCLVQLNNGGEALAAFQKSLAIDSTLYAARLGLGAAYNLMGETQQAIDVFEAAVEEFPDLPDAYNNLAVMYKKAGRMEDHNRILRAAPKSSKSPKIP